MERPGSTFPCIYCNVSFNDKLELRAHCQTETHEMMIMSDEGHDWHWRAPPRGAKSDNYVLCESFRETGNCRYGYQCVEAHGIDELEEWKQRFKYREMKLQRAKDKELFGKSYTEEFLEKLIKTANPSRLMRETLEEVEFSSTMPLTSTVSSKNSQHEWTLFIHTKRPLRAVALLQDTHRNHYYISNIIIKTAEIDIKNDQEWLSPIQMADEYKFAIDYKIKVVFKTDIFGTFRQSIVFDFYTEPVLVKHLCVDVIPDTEIEKINEIRKEVSISTERWTPQNSNILTFCSQLVGGSAHEEWEEGLKSLYPCPQSETFYLSNSTVNDKFTKNNYRERMHQLLYVEEMARYELIAQYNLTTKLRVTHSYILSPNSMAASTAKYSSNGELFASLSLGKQLSEDTSEGRLILMHCTMVLLSPSHAEFSDKREVYEALIEDKGKTTIYLRLSSETVKHLELTPDTELEAHIQFQLNRIPYCQWHFVLDKMCSFKMIFPETYIEPTIPWSPSRQWSGSMDSRLNGKQKEAIMAITTPLQIVLPPILVIGPFGTGKTFTLAQAIKELIKEPGNRILLCTHSNSAADLYIKDYLHPLVEGGDENARPLRIYYEKRWVTTVSNIVQKYCCIKTNAGLRSFQIPTLEDIKRHKIIVATLSTSVFLSALGLPQGHFTHILVDEAAQAIECETVIPLALANDHTRIVLAGDHMQLGPDIFSDFARGRNMHISLLERLYDHYPPKFPCKILLCQNYRAHESIIQFTSESFYDQKLVSSSKQPAHSKFFPLTFFTTRGEDVQDKNSTAFYNNSEVYEVVERVLELKRSWPPEWGNLNDQSIGVVTPYADQVFRIRSELRKKRIDNVCVERVLNVQGKQFRSIILSTVRTRGTCTNDSNNNVDYGFLSNLKLLNTAITRAQSLVAVVGDPIALCSVGRCSKVWERFIEICTENKSLFGITWSQLKLQLDGIELKKIYTLNPLAPEFYPRSYPTHKVEPVIRPTMSKIIPAVHSPFLPEYRFYPPIMFSGAPPTAIKIPQPPVPPIYYNMRPPPVPNLMPSPGFNPPVRMMNPHHELGPPRPLPPPLNPMINPAVPINMAKAMPLHPPPQQSPITNNNCAPPKPIPPIPQSIPIQQPTSSSNKLIQFMSNVHFPEAQVLSDCINLLPQNMSLADMLLQPPNLQEQWYKYLRESSGLEAAEKFKYLLQTTNQKGTRVSDKNIFERATPQPCDSPTFNWYDSPTNQINFNKPVYMRENLPNGTNATAGRTDRNKPAGANNNVPQPVNFNPPVNQADVQRRVNEEFANLRINNEHVDAFTPFHNNERHDNVSTNHQVAPRFYKYFN
ncbi:probable helicase with zinc finger domain isoform X3 [Aethina tumida]|nr:probable helicase with zinc finger domain isoform X3 [Aethina tumida]